jgi:hypothetical protein
MGKPKRIIIATICGVLCGLICVGLASRGSGELARPLVYQIIAERTMIGVAIGISALAVLPWVLHGLLIGLVFSIPMAFGVLLAPDNPQFGKIEMVVATIVMGMIYGVLIELVTSVVFKARLKARQ